MRSIISNDLDILSEIFYHYEEIEKPEKQTFRRIFNIWVATAFWIRKKDPFIIHH